MGIFSGKDEVRGEVRDATSVMFDKRSSNGNPRDTTEPGDAKHAALLGAHRAAVADLHSGTAGYKGRHRA